MRISPRLNLKHLKTYSLDYLLSDVSPVLLCGPLDVFLGLVDLKLLLVQLVLQVCPGIVEGVDPPRQTVVGSLGVDQPALKVTDPPVLALSQGLEARNITVKLSVKLWSLYKFKHYVVRSPRIILKKSSPGFSLSHYS